MSADNGIYIAKFKDGYRVAHIQAVDNLDFFPKGSQEETDEWKRCFGKSTVFSSYDLALAEALTMAYDCPIVEYGVSYLGDGVDF